jgi:hypothetical protein
VKYPLRVGQVFTCSRFEELVGQVKLDFGGEKKPEVDYENLELGNGPIVHTTWTEKKGNWSQEHKLELDLRPERDFTHVHFIVLKVALIGGGTGMGPHDVYPDGHWVYAKEVDGEHFVRFHQSGCFRCMVEPEHVELIGGPEDVECKWIQRYVEEHTRDDVTVEACRHCGCEWVCPDCDGKGI